MMIGLSEPLSDNIDLIKSIHVVCSTQIWHLLVIIFGLMENDKMVLNWRQFKTLTI